MKRRRSKQHANGKIIPELGNGAGLLQRHVSTTLAALESVLDLEGAEPHLAAAFRSHKEAVELAS